MNKKSIYAIGLASGIILGSIGVGYAANQYVQAILNQEIKVSLNGQVQSFKDATTGETMYPLTYKDRTYLPLRNVAELSDLDVDYDNDSKTVILSQNMIKANMNGKYSKQNRDNIEFNIDEFNEKYFEFELGIYDIEKQPLFHEMGKAIYKGNNIYEYEVVSEEEKSTIQFIISYETKKIEIKNDFYRYDDDYIYKSGFSLYLREITGEYQRDVISDDEAHRLDERECFEIGIVKNNESFYKTEIYNYFQDAITTNGDGTFLTESYLSEANILNGTYERDGYSIKFIFEDGKEFYALLTSPNLDNGAKLKLRFTYYNNETREFAYYSTSAIM